MGRVTLQEIAEHLGVSKFAVSRALAGKSGVSSETRQNVVRAADELGYIPPAVERAANIAVRVLYRNEATAHRELWIDATHGVELQSMRSHLTVTSACTDDPETVLRMLRHASGLILIGPNEPAVMEAVIASKIPAVTVSHLVPPLAPIDQVTATDEEAGAHIAGFLAGLGHRHMVYVHGQPGFPGRTARLTGFAGAIAGIPGARLGEIEFPDDFSATGLRRNILRMIGDGLVPTAFFCGSDGVAVTLMGELSRLGIRVPDDVSIVGHADYPLATQVTPALTTLHMPHREMGMKAVDLLTARIESARASRPVPYQRLRLVPYLIERQSTGTVRDPGWSRLRSV
jgi:LacI family transcriptional regulator